MGFGGSSDAAKNAQAEEQARQARITQGTHMIDQQFAGFNPDFYNQRAADYVAYAMPQYGQQFRDVQGSTIYNLANRGLTKSSAARSAFDRLGVASEQAKQGIFDTGRQQAQSLQGNVEQQRSNLLSLLYQSADPGQVGGAASRTAASLQAPSIFAPVGELFNNITNQILSRRLIDSYRGGTSRLNEAALYGVNRGALP